MNDLSFLAGYSAVKARLGLIAVPGPVAIPAPTLLALPKPKPSANPVRAIIADVARKYSAKPELILSDSRIQRAVVARQEIMHRLLVERKMSLAAIGQRLNRHHSTVLHGIKAHIKRGGGVWVDPDREIRAKRNRGFGCPAMLFVLSKEIGNPVSSETIIAAIYAQSPLPANPAVMVQFFARKLRLQGHRIATIHRFGYMLLSPERGAE